MKFLLAISKGSNFQLQLSLFFAAIFLSVGCYLPYFPIWLKHKGLDSEQIAYVIGVPMMVRVLFTPAFSVWADWLGDFRRLLVFLSFCSMLSFLALTQLDSYWSIFLTVLIGAIFWTTLIPLSETMAMIAGDAKRLNYGRARAVGSASFIAASFGFGFAIDLYGPDIVSLLLVITAAIILFAAFFLPTFDSAASERRALSPPGVLRRGIGDLVRRPLFWLFLVGSGLGQGCHAFYYGFASVHWENLHYSSTLIGALWALGVIAEILLFVALGDWLRRFNPVLLMLVGGIASVIRFGVMAYDPPLYLLIPLQALHALSFGIAHLGAIYFIGAAVPARMSATAQGLYATVSTGVFLGGMVLVSGPLYEIIGPQVYLIMSAMAIAASAFLIALYTYWQEEPLGESDGKTAGE